MKEIGSVLVYNIEEAAKELETTEKTIRKYIKQGRMKCTQVGRRKFITIYQMDAFILGDHFELHCKKR